MRRIDLMISANTDPELHHWLGRASKEGMPPIFARTIAGAALIVCLPNYELLRSVLLKFKHRNLEAPVRCH